jgi:hypothetical protein
MAHQAIASAAGSHRLISMTAKYAHQPVALHAAMGAALLGGI